MDLRTAQIVQALDPISVDLLLVLLLGDASEKELLQGDLKASQPTIHRKLGRLADAGLIQRNSTGRARGDSWFVVEPIATAAMMNALFALADELDAGDRRDRARLRTKLNPETSAPVLRLAEESGR